MNPGLERAARNINFQQPHGIRNIVMETLEELLDGQDQAILDFIGFIEVQ